MAENLEIRLATEDDLEQLSQMRWHAREEGGEMNPALTMEEFQEECGRLLHEWIHDGSHSFWIASIDEIIVAHISVHQVDLLPRPIKIHDRFGVITENYTLPGFRNRGIGSKLLQQVIDWARQEDYELLIVYPSHRARSFYTRGGFSNDSEVMQLILREYISPSWTVSP